MWLTCGGGWTGLGLADTGVRGLDLPHVNGRSETTRRRGHPPAPVIHRRLGGLSQQRSGPRFAPPGTDVLNSCPGRRRFQHAGPKPTDKRHRIVKQVGNVPTEASFQSIGMFPSHQMGNIPIDFSGPQLGCYTAGSVGNLTFRRSSCGSEPPQGPDRPSRRECRPYGAGAWVIYGGDARVSRMAAHS
jgi:hypothetical protein